MVFAVGMFSVRVGRLYILPASLCIRPARLQIPAAGMEMLLPALRKDNTWYDSLLLRQKKNRYQAMASDTGFLLVYLQQFGHSFLSGHTCL